MFRQAVCASLRRVNRVGLKNSSPRWAGLVLSHTRTYTVPSPEPTSSSPTLATKSRPPLPALPDVPPVGSDFSPYLEPLYEYGWMPATPRRDGKISGALYRNFDLPSRSHLKAFLEKTRNTAASIIVRRNLQRCDVSLDAPDGVTWSTIRSALAYQTEYEAIVAFDQLAAATIPSPPKPVQPLAPIASATLPSPPPPPPFPPPSITEADLNLYIQPLAANGWSLKSASPSYIHPSPFFPCLHRVYNFHDTTSARDFFNAVVAAIPVPVNQSNGGVDVRFQGNTVRVWSVSAIAKGERRNYGISHTDVRFALALEGMFAVDWAARARNVDGGGSSGQSLHTMEDVWKTHPKIRGRRRPAVVKASGGINEKSQEEARES
ncbi:hypothetical protein DFH09DRAFT_1373204 [Mycena vulgaris]|nr:hypothetical protein DFH09DRAFT_1373204 [Mycena vulgaris]